MTDILEMLRDLQAEFYGDECLRSDLKKAADEVKRLREEIEFWKNADSATKEMSEELKRSLFAEIERLRGLLRELFKADLSVLPETRWGDLAGRVREALGDV